MVDYSALRIKIVSVNNLFADLDEGFLPDNCLIAVGIVEHGIWLESCGHYFSQREGWILVFIDLFIDLFCHVIFSGPLLSLMWDLVVILFESIRIGKSVYKGFV